VLKNARELSTLKLMEQTNQLFLKANHKKLMLQWLSDPNPQKSVSKIIKKQTRFLND